MSSNFVKMFFIYSAENMQNIRLIGFVLQEISTLKKGRGGGGSSSHLEVEIEV